MLSYCKIFLLLLLLSYHELSCSKCDVDNFSTKDCNANAKKLRMNLDNENDKIYLKLPPIATDNVEVNEKYYDDSNIENDPREKFFFVETSQRDHLRMYFFTILLNIIRPKRSNEGTLTWILNIPEHLLFR